MKLILLAYLLMALYWRPIRQRTGVQMAMLRHALALCGQLHRPCKVAWAMACRRHP